MIKKLKINNFRNYICEDIIIPEDKDYGAVILFGDNGAGKTNILETISLFSQSKGLRSAKYEEMINRTSNENFWNIVLQTDDDLFSSGYVKGEKSGKRMFKVFEKSVRDLSEFSKRNYVLWLTYETDRLFLQSPPNRREFVDMLCSAKIKNHMNCVYNYEKLTKERLKILNSHFDSGINKDISKWLNIIEEKISNLGLTIAQSRVKIIKELEGFQIGERDFPAFKNEMSGELEVRILDMESERLPEFYRSELFARRQKDYFSGSTTFGPNRSDWKVFHVGKQIGAHLCSAGEQKILLTGIFLSFVANVLQSDNRNLILLLDDVIAHLDFEHRKALFKRIKNMILENKGYLTVWLSGTERDSFEDLKDEALFFKTQDNFIRKDEEL